MRSRGFKLVLLAGLGVAAVGGAAALKWKDLAALIEASDLRGAKMSSFPRHQLSTLRGTEAFKTARLNGPGRTFWEHESVLFMQRIAPEPLGEVRAVPRT